MSPRFASFPFFLLVAGPALAADSEPVVVATAHLKGESDDPRAVAESLGRVGADLMVLTECTRKAVAAETLEAVGMQLLVDGRDPSPWGICLVGKVEGDTAVVPALWGGPCVGPMAVSRLTLGATQVAMIGVHLPPRVPVCESSTDGAVLALAGLVKEGRLVRDLGPARAGDAVILAGDLGSQKKQLDPLRAVGLAEIGEKAGRTLTTWSMGPIRQWPDHIFVPASWSAAQVTTFAVPGSDHQGVVGLVEPG